MQDENPSSALTPAKLNFYPPDSGVTGVHSFARPPSRRPALLCRGEVGAAAQSGIQPPPTLRPQRTRLNLSALVPSPGQVPITRYTVVMWPR